MTKEEALYETHKDIQGQGLEEIRVGKAMDIFARQQSIGFTIWATSYFDCHEFNDVPKWNGMWEGKDIINYDTEQLYDLYIKTLENEMENDYKQMV